MLSIAAPSYCPPARVSGSTAGFPTSSERYKAERLAMHGISVRRTTSRIATSKLRGKARFIFARYVLLKCRRTDWRP
jgi:hypothetical protein